MDRHWIDIGQIWAGYDGLIRSFRATPIKCAHMCSLCARAEHKHKLKYMHPCIHASIDASTHPCTHEPTHPCTCVDLDLGWDE